ncbi:MAG: hypothetical protein FJW20_07865 [Acidimicrobiia bacterium]|nr:hypothetical protein [Acidimicrobiia bacterium]
MAPRLCTFVLAAAALGQAATLRVGPGQLHSGPCSAFAAAAAGDTIEIDSTAVYSGQVCEIRTAQLTIRGTGSTRARMTATVRNGVMTPAGDTMWTIRSSAQFVVIENIDFAGVRLATNNGAAIRVEDGVSLVIRDCRFTDHDAGVITGNGAGLSVIIEHSIFDRIGNRNTFMVSVGQYARFTFQANYCTFSTGGHMVSSRASQSFLIYNRISNEVGFGDLEVDLPVGGRAFLIGNIFQQEEASSDKTIVSYQREAPVAGTAQELFVLNNTFSNRARTGTFVLLGPAVNTPVTIRNNVFHGPGSQVLQPGSGAPGNFVVSSHNFAGDPGFLDLPRLDFRLREGSAAIDAGVAVADIPGVALTPDRHYSHTACATTRRSVGPIDIGAYEFNGDAGMTAGIQRCRVTPPAPPGEPPAVSNGASFLPDRIAPGSIASIFGKDFSTLVVRASSTPLPIVMNEVSVTVNLIPAPLFFVSPEQINIQIPTGVEQGDANVVVRIGAQTRPAARIRISRAAPGIFFHSGNRAVAQNQDFTLNLPENPALPGSVITVYMTGQGPLTRFLASGTPSLAFPLAEAALPSRATVGGRDATIHFLGMTPGLVGVLQANIEIPELGSGEYPVMVTVDDVASNTAWISVGAR